LEEEKKQQASPERETQGEQKVQRVLEDFGFK